MRLRRIRWKSWGTPPNWPEWSARHNFKRSLENSGACVHAFMWTWEIRWC